MTLTEQWADFAPEAYSRNSGILTDKDQSALQECRVLVAGCGSVGGAVVEPLVRLGVQSLTLADPDTYALHNLNRQACVLEEIGESKPLVLARRAGAINPHAHLTTVTEGITPENVDLLVEAVDIVFDGVDIGTPTALWAKYLVHDRAAARGLPVLSGVDLGGQPTVFVWDYRRDPRPFYGRTPIAAFRQGKELEAALRFVGLSRLPRDFIGVIRGRAESGDPWPQITYAADGIGVLASRAIIDISASRPVPKVVSVDVHMRTRRRPGRIVERARWPGAALGLLRATASAPPPSEERPEELLSANVRRALEAVRRAPSAMNTQPWLIDSIYESGFRLRHNPQRELGAIDPDGSRKWMSIGCAIEALGFLFDDAHECLSDEGGFLVRLPTELPRAELLERREAILGLRHTNRGPYVSAPLAAETLAAIVDRAVGRPVEVKVVEDAFAIGRIAREGTGPLAQTMRSDLWWHDYLKWIRVSARDYDWDEDGVDVRGLGIKYAGPLFRGFKRGRPWRRSRLQLHRILAEQQAVTIEQSAVILELSVEHDGDAIAPVELGRAMMACWLAATEHGVALQPLAEISNPAWRKDSRCGVRVRLGYPRDVACGRSARLPMRRILDA